jgi:hypothetical protein
MWSHQNRVDREADSDWAELVPDEHIANFDGQFSPDGLSFAVADQFGGCMNFGFVCCCCP